MHAESPSARGAVSLDGFEETGLPVHPVNAQHLAEQFALVTALLLGDAFEVLSGFGRDRDGDNLGRSFGHCITEYNNNLSGLAEGEERKWPWRREINQVSDQKINQVVDVGGHATRDAAAMRRAMLTTIGVPLPVAATSAEAMRSDLSMAVSRTATDLLENLDQRAVEWDLSPWAASSWLATAPSSATPSR